MTPSTKVDTLRSAQLEKRREFWSVALPGAGARRLQGWGGMLHAVLVGVNATRDAKVRPLAYARQDAEAFAELLHAHAHAHASRRDGAQAGSNTNAIERGIERGIENAVRITLLVDEAATKAAIAHVMTDELLRCVAPEDTVLLYFAGYGSPEIDTVGPDPSIHLITHDTELARLHATSINVLSELATWTRRLPASTIAMIFDTSFNGMPGGRTFEGPGLRSGPRTRALDRISPSRATVGPRYGMLTACSEKEVAREAEAYGHGFFTHHLLEALAAPEIADGPVSLETLHRIISAQIASEPASAQHPGLYGTGVSSPLCSFRDPRDPRDPRDARDRGPRDAPDQGDRSEVAREARAPRGSREGAATNPGPSMRRSEPDDRELTLP